MIVSSTRRARLALLALAAASAATAATVPAGPSKVDAGAAAAAPPVCARAFAQPMVLWPPDRKLVDITIQNLGTRPGDAPRVEIVSVRQNEPPQAAGDEGGKNPNASPCPDASITGSELKLRAERRGDRSGRIYVVGFRVTTRNGGSCLGEVTVRVPLEKGRKDEQPPGRDDATFDATRCD